MSIEQINTIFPMHAIGYARIFLPKWYVGQRNCAVACNEPASCRTLPMRSMTVLLTVLMIGLPFFVILAQPSPSEAARPKLVVGIIIDQMRQEYLYRYAPKFGEGGFKRLMRDGFMLKNAHYNYVPTHTGPGHASVYTGTTPAGHGIVGNSWYDRAEHKTVNCVEDDRYTIVGSSERDGGVSPGHMLATTVTDELKLATQRRAKVIGLSFKDRGAVLPAGHMADGAYWYDSNTGQFITSTYYVKALPDWLVEFNAQGLPDQYAKMTWNPVYPLEQYRESGPDDTPYEMSGFGTGFFFPHMFKTLSERYGMFNTLPLTPFGNDLLTRLALAALKGEHMGQDAETDFLALSYSSTDILGHAIGPNAVELEDMYIRLDNNLAQLFNRLDSICKGQYVVFLAADHGVADVEDYSRDMRLLPPYYRRIVWSDSLARYLQRTDLPMRATVDRILNQQVYISPADKSHRFINREYTDLLEGISAYMLGQPGVADVFTRTELRASCFGEPGIRGMMKRGFYHRRSGDIAFAMEQGITGSRPPLATTHGTGYAYDTHVPVLFYGWGIERGSTVVYHPITDIAPTLSVLLKIKMPSNVTGNPIAELWGD